MSGRRAAQAETARTRVNYLEFSLIAYAGYPAAAARIERQLAEARRVLAGLEEEK